MIIRSKPLDSAGILSKHFTPYQIEWIQAETPFHNQRKRVMALAEKSVRIGWTYADAFKNVRKRLWFRDRDYLFATKDYQSPLEYVHTCYRFAEIFNLTHSITCHGEESMAAMLAWTNSRSIRMRGCFGKLPRVASPGATT